MRGGRGNQGEKEKKLGKPAGKHQMCVFGPKLGTPLLGKRPGLMGQQNVSLNRRMDYSIPPDFPVMRYEKCPPKKYRFFGGVRWQVKSMLVFSTAFLPSLPTF
jgi:hypothetical protein